MKRIVRFSEQISSAPSPTTQTGAYPSMRVLRFNSSQQKQTGKNGLNYLITSFMLLFHVGAVAAVFFFTWEALFVDLFVLADG